MKILLTTLNSKYVHSNLALRYLLASAIMKNDREDTDDLSFELKEFTINNDQNYIFSEIARANYDMVCFSCYIWNISQTSRLAEDLKKAKPEILICVGGPEVSFDSEKFIEDNPWVDFVLSGEGEESFPALCKALSESVTDLESIEGLTYRTGENILKSPICPAVDFNEVPFPYDYMECDLQRVIYYESTRGCPYRCSYCLSSIEKGVRAKNIDKVKRELFYFIQREVMQVKFVDRTFNYDRDRAYEIFKFLIINDNGKTNFHFEICGELLDEKTFSLLQNARKGLFQMEIGIQSANEETLKEINRHGNLDVLMDKIRKLVAMNNIHTHVDLIAGLPYESYESFGKSFDCVYELGCQALQLGFLKVLKGTPICNQVVRHNIVFRSYAPYEVISTKYITAEELVKLKMIENVLDIYYNRGGFPNSISYMAEASGKGSFAFYEDLAEFYYRSGFQHRDRKKEDQYRILFKFTDYLFEKGTIDDKQHHEAMKLIIKDAESCMNPEIYKRFIKKGMEIWI